MSEKSRLNLQKNLTVLLLFAVFFQLTGIEALRAAGDVSSSSLFPSVKNTRDGATIIIRNSKTVLVNGQKGATGASIISGARIETHDGAEAEVQIKGAGTLKIFSRAIVVVTFNNNRVDVKVEQGCVSLFVAPNSDGALTLPNGDTKITKRTAADDTQQPSELNSCDTLLLDTGGNEEFLGLPMGGLVTALIIGGAGIAAFLVASMDNDSPDQASPSRP